MFILICYHTISFNKSIFLPPLGKAEPKQLLEKVVQNPTFGKGGAKYTFRKGIAKYTFNILCLL